MNNTATASYRVELKSETAAVAGEEVPVFIICAIISLIAWIGWLVRIGRVTTLGSPKGARTPLLIAPLACAASLLAILKQWASFDVVNSIPYLLFYTTMGAAWVGIFRWFFKVAGIFWVDDVLERGNRAATMPVIGALLGLTFAFAGGNIGDGPGWWVVVFSSGVASVTWFVLWLLLELVTRPSEAITVNRDNSCGFRLGAYLIASGAICGRGAAGNWVSPEATVRDFLPYAAGAAGLTAVVCCVEMLLRDSLRARFRVPFLSDLLPGAIYVAAAVFYITRRGWW